VPAAGSEVLTDTDVAVHANPNERSANVYLQPDLRGKSRQEADAAYGPLDVTPSQLDDVEVILPEGAPNLDYGPGEVTRQVPAPGSRVHVGTEPQVFERNPDTAPDPGTTGGPTGQGNYTCGLSAPTVAFDGSPFANAQLGNKFPFALATWLGSSTGGLATTAQRPNGTFSVFGESADLSFLSHFDGSIALLRLALSFLMWTGVAWFLYGRTIGKGT
jgi:hypothetical protein